MAGGKDVRERLTGAPGPFFVPRRYLGGDDDATGTDIGFQHFADQAFAMSAAVRQCGIEERDPAVDGFAQGFPCGVVSDAGQGNVSGVNAIQARAAAIRGMMKPKARQPSPTVAP